METVTVSLEYFEAVMAAIQAEDMATLQNLRGQGLPWLESKVTERRERLIRERRGEKPKK